jgi:hypothetical protein
MVAVASSSADLAHLDRRAHYDPDGGIHRTPPRWMVIGTMPVVPASGMAGALVAGQLLGDRLAYRCDDAFRWRRTQSRQQMLHFAVVVAG